MFLYDSVSALLVCWKAWMITDAQPAHGGMKDSTVKGTDNHTWRSQMLMIPFIVSVLVIIASSYFHCFRIASIKKLFALTSSWDQVIPNGFMIIYVLVYTESGVVLKVQTSVAMAIEKLVTRFSTSSLTNSVWQ